MGMMRRKRDCFSPLKLVVLAVLLTLLGAQPAWGLEVTNTAVSRVGGGSAVLVVKADATVDATVDYGLAPGAYTASSSGNGRVRHELNLTGLVPDATVYYRVTLRESANPASSLTLPEAAFKTGKSAGQPFSFTVVGDNRPPSGITQPAAWATIVAQMAAENPDLSLHLGDIIYGLAGDSLALIEDKYDALFVAGKTLTDSVPLYPALGNHEVVSAANAKAGYEQEFTLPVNSGPDAALYGEHYYSFDHGDTHFVVLSTEIPGQEGLITGNQKAWLVQDLSATAKPWIVASMHRPLFSGSHGLDPWVNSNNAAGQQNKAEIHALFKQYGVDLVLAGHDHHYLHHVEEGIHYLISGGGGSSLSNPPALKPGDVFAVRSYEHVKVDETPYRLTVSAIDSTGATLESFTVGGPTLNLSATRAYWASYFDYALRSLSVDFSFSNPGAGSALGLSVTSLGASNRVRPQSAVPLPLSDLPADQSRAFTVRYRVPQGVASFRAFVSASYNDAGGGAYLYPVPASVR